MSQYTYTLNPNRKEEEKGAYKQSELEKMTTFHLREICRKERLVVSPSQTLDKESLVRLIMRFRGQKEYCHIKTDCEGGLERLQEYLQTHEVRLSKNQNIRVPATIVLYQKTEINELDNYQVQSNEGLYEGNLLLVDEALHVYTCFYIKQVKELFYLLKGKEVIIRPLEKHRYSLLYFKNQRDSDILYHCYYGNRTITSGVIEGIQIPLLDIQEKEVATTILPLVIDFGSSSTTMGICRADGSMEIAKVNGSPIIPSMIGIKIKAKEEVEFLFGRDAKEFSENNYRDEDVAVFYDIKRWITDVNQKEGVILQNGYKYQFSRQEMLRAYMEYLLDVARQQFKCEFTWIQFLAPVRQKEKFETLFQELLPEYTINCELDKGMAVLFYSINRLIQNKSYDRKSWYHALIIDCGGEMTDLTSGKFKIDNTHVSYVIDMQTQYENGDANFGGNNLTYRILQLLKIRIAEELGFLPKEEIPIEDEGIYEKVESRYQQAEVWIPTKFQEYETKSREQYFFVKNNYYYLFALAEQVKKEFFQPKFCYKLSLSTKKEATEHELFLDKWKLSICQKGVFSQMTEEIKFSLYLNEVEELLRPEIYGLMERFLDKKYEQEQLLQYEIIKLTGQSCQSRLFTEALKQYIPGKLIQNSKKSSNKEEFKMCCLEGALAYFLNCKLGYMKVNQSCEVECLPYEIMAFTHENKEKILIQSLDYENQIGYISRFQIGTQLDLYLSDERGNHLKTYYYPYDTTTFQKTTQEDIDQKYKGTVIQEETDNIVEGEMKFFVWASKPRWGFVVLPVLRTGEQLYQGEETFFEFEDGTWELNFFDGKK